MTLVGIKNCVKNEIIQKFYRQSGVDVFLFVFGNISYMDSILQ